MSKTHIEITDEMVDRAYEAYYTRGRLTCHEAMRLVLEAALNPPPVLCKHCGKPQIEHVLSNSGYLRCPGYVWEPSE